MNPAPFNQAVTPICPVQNCLNSFLGRITLKLSPYDDCISVLSDPEEDLQTVTLIGLDLPTNSVVTFLYLISPFSKIPSNPASHDKTPASPLRSTNKTTKVISNPVFHPSAGLQLSISLPENDHSKPTDELPPFSSFLSDVRPFCQSLITSNFNLIILLLDVNIAVQITQITQAG